MFLFESVQWYQWAMWFGFIVGLMVLNGLSRYKGPAICLFIVLPILLTIFVWPETSSGGGGHAANWFAWAKVYSSLLGCLIFMALRYSKKIQQMKWVYILPAAILAINITEAVLREFEVMNMQGFIDGMFFMGGPWNAVNAIAGIINILCICGWFGIIISKNKQKDMIWPDMLWFWIVAYDLWNFAYMYNCNSDRSFYAIALLVAATVATAVTKKGAWLQHRAHTLALYMMLMLTIPAFFVSGTFAVSSVYSPTVFWTISIISLLFNVGVAVYQIKTIIKNKKNPLKDEIFIDHKEYKMLRADNI